MGLQRGWNGGRRERTGVRRNSVCTPEGPEAVAHGGEEAERLSWNASFFLYSWDVRCLEQLFFKPCAWLMVKWDRQSLYLRVCEVKSIMKDSWVLWGCHADIYWASGKVLEWPFPEQTPVWLLGTGGPHYPMVCVCSWSLMCYKDWILGAAGSLSLGGPEL